MNTFTAADELQVRELGRSATTRGTADNEEDLGGVVTISNMHGIRNQPLFAFMSHCPCVKRSDLTTCYEIKLRLRVCLIARV
jgi:hypothetical protein